MCVQGAGTENTHTPPHPLPRTSGQCHPPTVHSRRGPRLLAQSIPPSSDTDTLLNPPSSLCPSPQPPPSNSHPRLTPPLSTPRWAPPTSNHLQWPSPASSPSLHLLCLVFPISFRAPGFPLRPQLPTPPHPSSTVPPPSVPHRPLSVPCPSFHPLIPPSRPHTPWSALLWSGTPQSPTPPPCLLNSLCRFSLVSD